MSPGKGTPRCSHGLSQYTKINSWPAHSHAAPNGTGITLFSSSNLRYERYRKCFICSCRILLTALLSHDWLINRLKVCRCSFSSLQRNRTFRENVNHMCKQRCRWFIKKLYLKWLLVSKMLFIVCVCVYCSIRGSLKEKKFVNCSYICVCICCCMLRWCIFYVIFCVCVLCSHKSVLWFRNRYLSSETRGIPSQVTVCVCRIKLDKTVCVSSTWIFFLLN